MEMVLNMNTNMKRKEFVMVHEVSLLSQPKKIKLEHATFPHFMEEEEDSPIAFLHGTNEEMVNNTSHHAQNQDMDLIIEKEEEEEELKDGLMEIDNETERLNQNRRPVYLWTGFF